MSSPAFPVCQMVTVVPPFDGQLTQNELGLSPVPSAPQASTSMAL